MTDQGGGSISRRNYTGRSGIIFGSVFGAVLQIVIIVLRVDIFSFILALITFGTVVIRTRGHPFRDSEKTGPTSFALSIIAVELIFFMSFAILFHVVILIAVSSA